jgi:HAD superfamily hydrolase (TIGR01509 family)
LFWVTCIGASLICGVRPLVERQHFELGAAMIELVIFDCDGVLVDSERLAIKVDVKVLARLGWSLSEEEIVERFVGVSDLHFRRAIEAQLGRALPDDWESEFQPLYRQEFSEKLRPVEGIVEALPRISLSTCVASSGTHEKMQFTLGLTGLYERFRGRIFSATEVAHSKPAPDLFLYAATKMGVAPQACVVVEDSVAGVRAARAAGMSVLAYAGGVTPASKLEGPGTTVFWNMSELPALVSSSHIARA